MAEERFRYFDFKSEEYSNDISLLLPDWGEDEVVVVFSPHDDDALLGAGYSMMAAKEQGAEVYVFIFCRGDAGYSSLEEKDEIVSIRKEESLEAYSKVGIDEAHIFRLAYDDFSVLPYLGRNLPDGKDGTFTKTVPALREINATRLLIPNGYREHLDHSAVNQVGAFDGPQVGDPILVDWGKEQKIKSFLEYAVWGDFSPEDSLISSRSTEVRGNRLVIADPSVEEEIRDALYCFHSQEEIIEDLVAQRQDRKYQRNFMEIYLDFDPRPRLEYQPYKDYLDNL